MSAARLTYERMSRFLPDILKVSGETELLDQCVFFATNDSGVA
jgi:hypothetical protein